MNIMSIFGRTGKGVIDFTLKGAITILMGLSGSGKSFTFDNLALAKDISNGKEFMEVEVLDYDYFNREFIAPLNSVTTKVIIDNVDAILDNDVTKANFYKFIQDNRNKVYIIIVVHNTGIFNCGYSLYNITELRIEDDSFKLYYIFDEGFSYYFNNFEQLPKLKYK